MSTLASGASGDGVPLVVVLAFGLANLVIDIASGVLFCAYPDAVYKAVLVAKPESQADGGMNIRSALTHVVADTYRTVAVLVTRAPGLADDAISPAADAQMAPSPSRSRSWSCSARAGGVEPVRRAAAVRSFRSSGAAARSRRLLHPRDSDLVLGFRRPVAELASALPRGAGVSAT